MAPKVVFRCPVCQTEHKGRCRAIRRKRQEAIGKALLEARKKG